MKRLLLIDDDPSLLQLLGDYLTRLGYDVAVAPDGSQGLARLGDESFDLAVLDVRMPGLDGWQTLERIRAVTTIPVIMLTALSDEPHVLRGFALGADDYVAKPLSFAQLGARIEAVLKRTQRGEKSEILQAGGLQVDIGARRVQRDGRLINLTPTEFKLLVALMEQPERVLTPRQLVVRVWGPEFADDTGYIRRYVWHLRQKLQPDSDGPQYIHNERGFGYYFTEARTI